MPPRVLVLGAGGLLGRALRELGLPGLDRRDCDVTRPAQVERALRRFRPEAVILCAAVSEVDRCERDPRSWEVNARAPGRIARLVPTWFVSSNYVFSGPGPHRPDSPRRPLQAYGRQKAEAEESVLAAGGHVLRTGWLYGPGGRNFPSTLPARLARGETVRALAGPLVQPTWAPDLARVLARLPEGVTHAVGREEGDWYGFARLLARELGGRVVPVSPAELALPAPRPEDARLAPAELPGWSERLPELLALARGAPPPR